MAEGEIKVEEPQAGKNRNGIKKGGKGSGLL